MPANPPPAKWQPPVVPVNWPVQFLPHAVEKETPQAADVTLVDGRFVSLFVKPSGAQPRPRRAVPYIHDPQEAERTVSARRERGAWRFIPGHEYPQAAPERDTTEAKPSEQNDLTAEERILNMTAEGLAPAQIAKELGEPWTHQRIGQVLSRLKKK